MTRVATSTAYRQALQDLQRNQAEIARLQAGVGSGQRILKPSDDPAGASRVLDLTGTLGRLEQYATNARLADQRLALEDSTLEGVQELLVRVKELALAAGSGAQSAHTREAYRVEVRERLSELLGLANVRDGNGDYLFAGYRAQIQPFASDAGGVSYYGDAGARELQVSDTRRVAAGDSGAEVFMRVPGGNGRFTVSAAVANTGAGVLAAGSVEDVSAYTAHAYSIRFTGAATFDVVDETSGVTVLAAQPFTDAATIAFDGISTRITGQPAAGDRFDLAPGAAQPLFQTLQDFIAALALEPGDAAGTAQQAQALNHVIDSLDRGLDHVLEARASVGARRSALEAVETQNEDLRFELEATRSQVRDLDMTAAIAALQQRISALEAVQQSFVAVSRLSLFNFLG